MSLEPHALVPERSFKDLAFGDDGGCAVSELGELWCWGALFSSALPQDTTNAPVRIGAASDWTRVWLGESNGCGLRGQGELWCWGRNTGFVLGPESEHERIAVPRAVQAARRFTEVSLGAGTLCAVETTGSLVCWGRNDDGELATKEPSSTSIPLTVLPGRTFAQVALAPHVAYGVEQNGDLSRWFALSSDAGMTFEDLAVSVREVKLGPNHQCALQDAGLLLCGGANAYGQLGQGTTTQMAGLAQVVHDEAFSELALRFGTTCGLSADGSLWCWGRLYAVGSEATSDTATTPKRVLPAARFRKLGLNEDGACALDLAGALVCWGNPADGTLGEVVTAFSVPQRVPLP